MSAGVEQSMQSGRTEVSFICVEPRGKAVDVTGSIGTT